MSLRRNRYRTSTPPNWNNIQDAPRDGTTIEIQNNWGVAAHYGICKWSCGGWVYVHDELMGMSDGPHLSWRPYSGGAADYIDPTNGEQNTDEYWRRACGL